jgi:hypothetical protein
MSQNSPDITIEDVQLQLENNGGHIEGKVKLTIELKNNSKTLTYYILKRPRNIDYDQDSHSLSIGLSEKASAQDTGSGAFEPAQIAIPPDTRLQWQYLLPLWMKKITRPHGSREVVEVVNISGVQKVACTVAYHTSPFRLLPSDKPEDLPLALSRWGATVSASFDKTLLVNPET